jgi:hypothetical protein
MPTVDSRQSPVLRVQDNGLSAVKVRINVLQLHNKQVCIVKNQCTYLPTNLYVYVATYLLSLTDENIFDLDIVCRCFLFPD